MSTPYPTAYQIEEMFSSRATQSTFNSYCAENIEITIVGKEFNVGGYYRSAQHFDEECFNRIVAALRQETVRVEVLRVIGGGESAWAAVESFATGMSKYDKPYHVEYVDLVRFDSHGKIAQLKEFWDNGHIHNHVEEHESKTKEAK